MNASQVWIGQEWASTTPPARSGGLPEIVRIDSFNADKTIAHCTQIAGPGSRRRPQHDIAVDVLLKVWRRV